MLTYLSKIKEITLCHARCASSTDTSLTYLIFNLLAFVKAAIIEMSLFMWIFAYPLSSVNHIWNLRFTTNDFGMINTEFKHEWNPLSFHI